MFYVIRILTLHDFEIINIVIFNSNVYREIDFFIRNGTQRNILEATGVENGKKPVRSRINMFNGHPNNDFPLPGSMPVR